MSKDFPVPCFLVFFDASEPMMTDEKTVNVVLTFGYPGYQVLRARLLVVVADRYDPYRLTCMQEKRKWPAGKKEEQKKKSPCHRNRNLGIDVYLEKKK